MALDKKAILKALQLKRETVKLGNGEVIVTEITAAEYMEVFGSPAVKTESGEFDGGKFTALLATRCIVDEKGNRVFDDDDADLLRQGSASEYTKIAAAVKRLNGLGADEKN